MYGYKIKKGRADLQPLFQDIIAYHHIPWTDVRYKKDFTVDQDRKATNKKRDIINYGEMMRK